MPTLTDASAKQHNRMLDLVWELHEITGRACSEIGQALHGTRTLRELGYKGDGHLTEEQADASISILESWIRQARNR